MKKKLEEESLKLWLQNREMLQMGLAAVAGPILCPSLGVSAAGLGVFSGAHEKFRQILGVLWDNGTGPTASLCLGCPMQDQLQKLLLLKRGVEGKGEYLI